MLTDNGTHFTTPGAGGSAAPLIAEALARDEPFWAHAFEYACATLGIEHRTTKPKHPWTNGQVDRMNRTIKDSTTTITANSSGIWPTSSTPTTSAAA